MTLKLTDTIIGKSRGSVAAAMAYAKAVKAYDLPFLQAYFTELWRLCALYGFAFEYLVGQGKNETGAWASWNTNWTKYHNPAGLAITNAQNLSLIYKTGEDAARAQVVHHYVYRYGAVPKGHELYAYTQLDGHYKEVVQGINTTATGGDGKPFANSIRTIGDFNVNGRWCLLDRNNTPAPAPLNDYGNRILADTIEVFGQLPNQQPFDPPVTAPSEPEEPPVAKSKFGLVPRPKFTNREIPTSQNTAFNNLGQRIVRAIFLHRMEGSLWGTDEYFRTMANAADTGNGGLTDFGTDATTGEALMWCNSIGTKSPWASGPVQNPIGSAAIFVDMYGKNAVNRFAESIETSGWGDDAVSAKWRAWVVAEIAYQADQYGKLLDADGDLFDYTTYPNIPSEQNREFVMGHGQSYDGKRNTCPGSVIMKLIPTINKEVQAILKSYQAGDGTGTPPPPVEPTYADAHPEPAGSHITNTHVFLAPGGKTFQRDTTPMDWADAKGLATGPVIKKGTKITQAQIAHYVQGTDGNLWVALTGVAGVKDGSRVPAASFI